MLKSDVTGCITNNTWGGIHTNVKEAENTNEKLGMNTVLSSCSHALTCKLDLFSQSADRYELTRLYMTFSLVSSSSSCFVFCTCTAHLRSLRSESDSWVMLSAGYLARIVQYIDLEVFLFLLNFGASRRWSVCPLRL